MNDAPITTGNSPPADLAWAAFRYIADEMGIEEREDFDDRLARDQQAREAVAHAVQLAEAVAAVPVEAFGVCSVAPSQAAESPLAATSMNDRPAGDLDVVAIDSSRPPGRLRAWIGSAVAVATAACLAFAVGVYVAKSGGPGASSLPGQHAGGDHRSDDDSTLRNATAEIDSQADGLVDLWTKADSAVLASLFPVQWDEASAGYESAPADVDDAVSDGEFDWVLAAVSAEMPSSADDQESEPQEN